MKKKPRKRGGSLQAAGRGAATIADSEGMVRSIGSTRWEVASQSTPGLWYRVDVTTVGIKCERPHYENRKSPCKHPPPRGF